MNADVLVKFVGLLDEAAGEADTLAALDEALQARRNEAAWGDLLALKAAGWEPNAPGLACERCDGRTWGKQVGHVELVKCVRCGWGREIVN